VRVRSVPVHVRRLTVATTLFALAVVVATWLGSELILRDLSDSFVSRVFAQAKEEVEAVARVASDPESMGEGDRQEPVRGGPDAAFDADVVLRPLLPEVFDSHGNPLDPLGRVIPRGAEDGLEVPAPATPPPAARPSARVPAVLSRSGQEWRYFVNGELIGRDAVQYIGITHAGEAGGSSCGRSTSARSIPPSSTSRGRSPSGCPSTTRLPAGAS